MLIRVNKKTNSRRPVKYAVLSTGTVSHVWYDDERDNSSTPKRRNHIRVSMPVIALQLKQESQAKR